jgi:hypothetical protein
VLKVAKVIYIYWPMECRSRVWFVEEFKVARIIYIYWSIECCSKVWFVNVVNVARITYIYWRIECTPKVSFVHVFEFTCIDSPIKCSPKLDLLKCSRLKRCKITPCTIWMYYLCNSQICVSSSYIHLRRKVPWLLFFQRIKVEASHHVCLRVSFLILDLLLFTTYTCAPNLVLMFTVMIYEPQPIPGPWWIFTRSLIESNHKLNTPHSEEFTTWSHSLAAWHNHCPHICKRGTSTSECFHGNQEVLQNSVIKKPHVHVMTTDAGLNWLGISMYWTFPFCGVILLYSFWLISHNTWFWDLLRLLQTFWHWWTS